MTASNRRRWLSRSLCFLLLSQVSLGGPRRTPGGIRVELRVAAPLRLGVTLQSIAATRTTIFKGDLPWMSQHRMILVLVGPSGECVRRDEVIGHPPPGEILLNPNETVSGDIKLSVAFKDFDRDVRRSELHLFWAYESPPGLGLPQWSGGWILIPQQNRK
jgi:hypothetical protein